MDQVQQITLDGETYETSTFSPAVQQAVQIHGMFQADLKKAQLDVIKNQAALQTIGNQISEAIRKEIADRTETAAANE